MPLFVAHSNAARLCASSCDRPKLPARSIQCARPGEPEGLAHLSRATPPNGGRLRRRLLAWLGSASPASLSERKSCQPGHAQWPLARLPLGRYDSRILWPKFNETRRTPARPSKGIARGLLTEAGKPFELKSEATARDGRRVACAIQSRFSQLVIQIEEA